MMEIVITIAIHAMLFAVAFLIGAVTAIEWGFNFHPRKDGEERFIFTLISVVLVISFESLLVIATSML